MKSGAVITRDWWEKVRKLPPEQAFRVLDAILAYRFDGTEPGEELDGIERFAVELMILDVRRMESSSERVKKNRVNVTEQLCYCNETATEQQSGSSESEKEKEEIRQDIVRIDYNRVFRDFNAVCKSLPNVTAFSEKRKKAIKACYEFSDAGDFTSVFRKVEESDFLTGRKTSWSACFDWLFITGNMAKVIEGNYDNKDNRDLFAFVAGGGDF